MFSHVTLGVSNIDRARQFYDVALDTLGIELQHAGDGLAGYATAHTSGPMLWVVLPFDNLPASVGNGTHVALLAPSRDAVDDFHRVALERGGSDEGPPGLRPHYHAHYYGAYVRDLDGNKLQACCHDPA